MNTKRLLLSFVVVYIVSQILGYLIHEVWLMGSYEALPDVWRPQAEMDAKMWIMFVTSAFFAFFFCYIFAKGYEGKGLMEGVRFGAVIGLFWAIPMAYNSYVVYPIPYTLALKWFVGGFAESVVLGVVAALTYKTEK